ncbi:uncharacterized protein [Haliotis asinina]|uniref:uncharacterized protein n=1 Tax=Haliotis asinina TaxID=109174 RepID=UPI0035319B56
MDKSMFRSDQHDYLKSDSVMCSIGQEGHTSIYHTLIDDLRKLDDDRVCCFAKLATVIPRLQDCSHCDGIDIPDYPQFWTRVLDLLIKQNEWLGVDLLVQTRNGPRSPLDGRAATLPTADIRISNILRSLSDVDLSDFGIRLAITLLEKGTPLESIVDEDEEPLMIAAVRSATKSGNPDLLKYVLERQPDLSLQIDQPDSRGDSPLHLCVKSPSLSVTHRRDLLELLLGLGCCVSVRDNRGKTAVQYLEAEDPCHQLLEQASRYAGEGLKKRMSRLKALGDSCFKQDEYREALKWYREAMVLAESVPNLKLDLALLHSSCSVVFVNLAIMEDEDEENSYASCRNMEELQRKKTQLLSLLSNYKTPVQNDYEDDMNQGQGDGPTNTSPDITVQLDYEDDLNQGQGDGPTNTSLDTTVQLDYEDDLNQGQGDGPTNTSPDITVQLDYEDDLNQGQGDGPINTSPDTTVQLDYEDDLNQGQGDGPTNTSSDTTVQLDYEDDMSQGDGPTTSSPDTTLQSDCDDDLNHGQSDGPTTSSPDTAVQLDYKDDLNQGQGDGPTATSPDTAVQLDYEDDLNHGQGDGPTTSSPDTAVQLDYKDDMNQGQGDGPTNTSPDTAVQLDYKDDLNQGQGDGPTNTSPDTSVQSDCEDDLNHGQSDGPTNTSSDTSGQCGDERALTASKTQGPGKVDNQSLFNKNLGDRASRTYFGSTSTAIKEAHQRKCITHREEGGVSCSDMPEKNKIKGHQVNEKPADESMETNFGTAEGKVFLKQEQVSKEQDEEECNAVVFLKPRREEVKPCEEFSDMQPEGRCSHEVIPANTHSNVSQLSNDGTIYKVSQSEVSGCKPKINQKIEIPAKPEKNDPSTTGNKMESARTEKPAHSLQMLPKAEDVLKEDSDICEISQCKSSLSTTPGFPLELGPRQLIDCTEKEMRGSLSVNETTDEETEDTNELSSSSGSNTITGSDASNVTVISRKPDSPSTCVKVETWLQTCDKCQPKCLRTDTDNDTSKAGEAIEECTKDTTVSCVIHSEDVPADLNVDSLQSGLSPSTSKEENYSLEKENAAVDEAKQKDKLVCTQYDSHSSDPVLDSGRSSTSTDHANKCKEQTLKQADHIDMPECTDCIVHSDTSNEKKHVVSSVSMKADDKSTSKNTIKGKSETDVFSSDVCESNAIAKFEERIPEKTDVPSQEPTKGSKKKTKKKRKKQKKKTMVTEKQTSEATQENDGHEMNVTNENVDRHKTVISKTLKEEKMQMVKSLSEKTTLTVSECKLDILEMIQNSSRSILESISAAASYGPAENAESREEDEEETAGEERGGDAMGILHDSEDDEDMEFKPELFDDLPWEVEFTADAWKHLRSKSVQMRLKQRAIKIITELANGNWRSDFYKPVSNRNIFKSELSKSTSLIWEKAVAFSGRCSDSPSKRMQDEDGGSFAVKGGRIYTQIIRVWDIVSSDDEIQKLLGSIGTSYKRGKASLLKRNLQGLVERPSRSEKQKQLPLLFQEQDMRVQEPITCMFFPPASPDPREYHILKFYAFTSALVNIVLSNMIKKADLPFKVTDKEHAIIHLSGEAPILLLGRSGTGKTTSCLYRLWTNFIAYWRLFQETGVPFIPRLEWIFAALAEDNEGGNPEDDEQAATPEADDVQPSFERQDEEEDRDYGEYDHLHQIFVTKNPVLCTEVHKNFYELCRACDETADHVETEHQEIPPRLQDVEDLSYPLFLTSKQLLMMLDGSLGEPYFFERNKDGSLGVTVRGWEEQGDVLGISLMDQDSDDEDFMGMNNDYDEDVLQQEAAAGLRQRKLDPRKEVTYEVFASTIWPKIKKKAKYHPSLVWTEIMSFIKGSWEALTKLDGHLSEEDYIEVGRKKAPNFSGVRETVYQLFERYDHFKKQNLMFDEADLVSDIFKRLESMDEIPWIVHQLYVDETQDFTQAELSVLLRITQHPNDMFLTGDTAQGIMRGISFRFCDLKSLFFHAKKSLVGDKRKMLNEPKQVYQLTHSYRSHGGILALASAVLDLMVEFFPESFDKLKKDQGLLDGPLPLLMESCSPQDLAILLQGNNRKASHIEFGAHQAILVVNDDAKEKMPDMLSRHSIVLTIYESKGLEFDDILLYNFFTDSQATKEWRVVTTFLESLAAQPHCEEQAENLHIIDAEMLSQPNRPRALAFEANEHKILNSELKYLYTALTRARVNVWIFDEDEEKRAPMFEYFKARQLVRCISQTEDGYSEFTHMVFAMKSSPEDWVKRGDEMMNQSLYEVAVNCYRMGEDENKEQIAIAHCQAQGALKLKDNPRKMREEFVCAAHKFLHCGEVMKAATCLQNAREFELAAKLFQRMKKFQEAARLYQRSGKHADASECYEELGLYNRAVELLHKEELHELAIDCLKRYQTKILEMRGTNREMLKVLESNKPGAQFTLENLYFKLVRFNHKHRNKPKMLAALENLPYDDQLEFLEKHQYLKEAVELMLKGGKSSHSDVAQMLLRHGATRDALYHAEKGRDVDVRGKCHHTLALELYLDMEEKSQHEEFHMDSRKKEIVSHFQKAATAFEETENNNSAGMAFLVIAMIQNRTGDAKRAFEFFRRVSPFANEAGMVEAMKIFVRSVSTGQLSDCDLLVTAVETLLTVINTFLKPDSREKHSRFTLYLKLYGLHQDDEDPNQLITYPRQKNLCADVLPEIFRWKDKRTVHLDKQVISFQLSLYLVGVLKEWINKCRNWLGHHVSRNVQCRSYQEGRCAGNRSCDNNNCHHVHEPFTRESALKGLKTLLLKVKLEYVLHFGVESLKVAVLNGQTKKDTLKEELTALKDDTTAAFEKLMQHFVVPESHHLRNLTENVVVMRMFSDTLDSVNLKSLVQEMVNCWCDNPLQEQCKSSDWFVRATTLVSLFKIQHIDLKKVYFNIKRQLQGSHLLKEETRYAFISFERGSVIIHLGGLFYEAFDAMKEDPVSSVFAYSKFVKILGDRNIPMLFPKMPLFLFWHEVFITVALASFAKLSSETGRFVLPATYLATLPFVSAMLPQRSRSIQWLINSVTRDKGSIKTFQDHIQRLAGVLCGNKTGMNLLSYLFHPRKDFNYLQAERCLILALVVLANVGLLLDPLVEVPLMEALMRLELPEDAPTRLKNGLHSIKNSHGIADLVDVLKRMLKEREDEYLLLCVWKWNPHRNEGIQHQQLKSIDIFPSVFVKFVQAVPYAEYEKENHAARVIQCFYRNLTLRRHIEMGNLRQRFEQQMLKEHHYHSDGYILDAWSATNENKISSSAGEDKREKNESKKYLPEKQEDRSARVLQRFFRKLTLRGYIEIGNLKQRCEQQMLKEKQFHFEGHVPQADYATNEEEISISAEEVQREKDEFNKFLREEQEDKSARVLQRFFRRLAFTEKIERGNIRARCQHQELKEIFSFCDITEDQCGVCRVSFKTEITDKPSFESDMNQTGTTVEMIQKEEGTQPEVFEHLMDQQKTSQKMMEEHLSSPIHMMNMMNCNLFKKLYKEYFVSKMFKIQTFMERMRKGEILMNMAAVHHARLEYMMREVQVLYEGIFYECKWDLVFKLKTKVFPLCMYHDKVSKELDMMKKQSMVQVDQQPQVASGDMSSIPDITRQPVGVDHVRDELLEVVYEASPRVEPANAEGDRRQNRDEVHQGYGNPMVPSVDNRGAGYGQGGASQQYGREDGRNRRGHGNHGRYYDGHNENTRGQPGHRGGPGAYSRGGQGNRGPSKDYGRGCYQPGQGDFGRGFGQQGHRGGPGVYYRGGQGNRGQNEYYGRGYNQRGAGGFRRGYGRGRGGGGPAGEGRGRGHYVFPNAPPRHQQFQQFQQQRHQFQ